MIPIKLYIYAAVAMLFIGSGLYIKSLRSDLKLAELQRTEAIQANEAYKAVTSDLQAEVKAKMKICDSRLKAKDELYENLAKACNLNPPVINKPEGGTGNVEDANSNSLHDLLKRLWM